MSSIKRYVPLGNNSIVTDAPGWLSAPSVDSQSEAQSVSTSGGPTCWKCKGRKLVPQKKKRKLREKSTSDDQNVSHLVVNYGKECTVCHGLGFLAPKKKEVTSLSSQPGMITNRRKCPEGWHYTGPLASAVQEMMIHSPFEVDSNDELKKNPLECLYLANNVENSGAGVSISGEYPKYPWCPSNFGEQLCNLVGSWRILQRTGSHRWTTDDIVTAHIGIQMALKRKEGHSEKKTPLRYLDLGCGNGSVLQMVSWGLLSEFELTAFGIEARSEAVSLARRSLTFNIGEGNQASVIHGDFRELEKGSEAFKEVIGNNILNQLEAFRKTRSKKFDLVTGTPPYFRVDFCTDNDKVEVTAATINQGGMPTSIQSAPARCEFRGGIEAYCKAAVSVMHEDGIFCVCENWLNNDRVYSGASAAGLAIISVHPVKGKMGRKEHLFAVYVMALSKPSLLSPRILDPLCVRDKEGLWTSTYAALLETMSIPAMHMINEHNT